MSPLTPTHYAALVEDLDRQIALYERAISQLGDMHAAMTDIGRTMRTPYAIESQTALALGRDALGIRLAGIRERRQWFQARIDALEATT